ncbi:HAD family hydrolase [Alteribacillus sp. YIM 98480]|uniref:HAD family hydrolase n=1 Tax=Alteribacillus sp. YIM 98480 TaxID=2606599 RepID=UPI00131D021B|nr:HAD family hydrolase [Alteribacillus sp. YIM 98480]
MYQSFIFDVDGTLIDTEEAILKSLQSALKNGVGNDYSIEELKPVLGIPGDDALEVLGVNEKRKVREEWLHYMESNRKLVKVFPGIHDTLKNLKTEKYSIGIVTSKTKKEFKEEVERFDLHPYADTIVCADDTDKHKPEPDPLMAYLQKSGETAKKAVYIGDTLHDEKCAHSAGIAFALAGWGAVQPEKSNPDHMLHTPNEILQLTK